MIAVISAVVAAVLAVGATVWAVAGSENSKEPIADDKAAPAPSWDDDSGSRVTPDRDRPSDDGSGKVNAGALWKKVAEDASDNGEDVPGVWLVGDTVVKPMDSKITAYDVASGKEAWSLTIDGDVCAAPRNASHDGRVVVIHEGDGGEDDCSQATLIDLRAGKQGWKRELPETGGFAEGFIEASVAVSGNAAGVTWGSGSALLSMRDGEELAAPDIESGCAVDGYAGGEVMLRATHCFLDGVTTGQLHQVDSKSGKLEWTHDLPKGYMVGKVYSTSPVVMSIYNRERESTGVVALKGDERRSVIELGDVGYQPTCSGMSLMAMLQNCTGVVVSDDTLYLPTTPQDGGGMSGYSNEIHAFDLDTGKRKGEAIGVKGRTILPVRMEGSKLIAFVESSYDEGGAVVSAPGTGGAVKTLLQTSTEAGDVQDVLHGGEVFYQDGRLFMASRRVQSGNGPYDTLLVAYGKN